MFSIIISPTAKPCSGGVDNSKLFSWLRMAGQGALTATLWMLLASLACVMVASGSFPAWANDVIISRGDLVTTGFSGIRPNPAPLPQGANPLDEFFIDLDGASAQIQSPAIAGAPPQGQLVPTAPKLRIKAQQVGQVFAIALDDGVSAAAPNVYLGATSFYGLNIVLPDADGDGAPERTQKGGAGAAWMAGQFGIDAGGGPGSIWRVDARGGVTLFATLPENSGAGIGDIAFDRAGRQFFVSDLDNGLIYRLSEAGQVLETFDHGVAGRPAAEMDPVSDDGSRVDLTSASFDTTDPETWAMTPVTRRVYGLTVRDGRLFYAVAGQIWSVGVSARGFASDARWEFDAKGLAGNGPITDLLFDAQGRLLVAQRGTQRASYDYSVFAEPEKSTVARYRREEPDDPATPSAWFEEPETYAIGLPPEHTRAEGGIALGYEHEADGRLRTSGCGRMLWSTGHRLRPGIDDAEMTENDVHGLQGNDADLVRPQNTPPQQSYFIDYDGLFGDAAKSGHMGDVEIWQPCEGAPDYASVLPGYTPGPLPWGFWPPGDLPPPDFPPPVYEYDANLRLTKRATPKQCAQFFGGWLCRYTVRVTNTGPDSYFGPIVIRDWLPANPPGAIMGFNWTCFNLGPSDNRCWKAGVFLAPTSSIDMIALAWVPDSYDKCHLTNAARIEWAPPGSIWNSDPTDDIDFAAATIPSKKCDPDGDKTDLKIYKEPALDCFDWNGGVRCAYKIRVENQGPGPYNGNIVVEDTIPNGATAIFSGAPGTWNLPCASVGNVYTCTAPGVSLPLPGDGVNLIARVDLSKALAKQLGCKVKNEAKITFAPGGSNQNTDPTNDDASAIANVPADVCNPDLKKSDLRIIKEAPANAVCQHDPGNWCRVFKITVKNEGPDTFNGVIKVTDTPSIGTVSFNAPGWNCAGNSCQTNAAVALQKNPPSADEVSFHATVSGTGAEARANNCRLNNEAKIDQPLGAPQNTQAFNDKFVVGVGLPEELCNTPVPKTNLKLEKEVDANGCLPGGDGFHCYYNVIVTNTGPNAYSDKITINEFIPAGTTGVFSWNCMGGTCTKNGVVLQPGEKVVMGAQINVPANKVQSLHCKVQNLAKITYAAGGSDQNTDASDDQDSAFATIPGDLCTQQSTGDPTCPPGFRWNGERCDRPDTDCKPGWTRVAGSGTCCPPGKPWNRRLGRCGGDHTPPPVDECPTRWTMTPVGGKCCPPGKPWNSRTKQCDGDDDTPPPTVCPPGLIGTPPNCTEPPGSQCKKTARCLNGLTFNRVSCSCECGDGRIMKRGQCVVDKADCPSGMVGTPPNCRIPDPPKVCPPGTRGDYPKCKTIEDPPKVCPPGTRGHYPKCTTIVDPPKVCPPGTRGHYPRCKKIEDPPKVCPPGTRGHYPRCKRIVDPVKHCPPGTYGRYPRCKKIVVVPKSCPPGTFGRPPRCRAIKVVRPPRMQNLRPHGRPVLRIPGGGPPRIMMRPPGFGGMRGR